MKIMLLNMPVRFNSWQNLEMPLGIAYIAACLEKNAHTVSIKDFEIEPLDEKAFVNEVRLSESKVVGISFRSSSYSSAKTIAVLLKREFPGMTVILGGHHASAFAEKTLEDIPADIVVRGEGENIMKELLEVIESGSRRIETVKGITYRCGKKISHTPAADPVSDLDLLPLPAWHLLKIDRYVTGSILTSRGCPFSCIYCDKGVSTKKVRFRSCENIIEEIITFQKKYRKERMYFVDDYFFLDKSRLHRLMELMIEKKTVFKWYCQARVDGIDAKTLGLAKKSGCEMIIFGIETGDRQELEYINKKSTLETAQRALKLVSGYGIKSRANFMVGFPITTPGMVANTVRFAAGLDTDLYRFFIVSPLPNTELWDRVAKEHPEFVNPKWDEFDFYSASFDTAGIKREDLPKYVMAAYYFVLKRKIVWELTIGFVPRFLKLVFLSAATGKIRGNLSRTFGACVNFLLEEWFILRHIEKNRRASYVRDMFGIARNFKKKDAKA